MHRWEGRKNNLESGGKVPLTVDCGLTCYVMDSCGIGK